jgi:hypothetical protein
MNRRAFITLVGGAAAALPCGTDGAHESSLRASVQLGEADFTLGNAF